MKGDFTRFTFDPKRHYKSVLMQQGRVVLDADWNEQADIEEHIRETAVRDVVGRCGSPIEHAGFGIDVAPGGLNLILSSGRIYVDGILCELEEEVGYFENPAFMVSEDLTQLTISDGDRLDLKKEQWVEISARIDSDGINYDISESPVVPEQVIRQVLWIVEIQKDPDANKMALTLDGTVNEDLINAAKSNGIYIKIFFRIEPEQAMCNESSATFLAYLDVWNRHITAVEDDSIREKALKGPDTSTRIKTEWRVRLAPCNPESIQKSIQDEISCHQASLILKNLLHLGHSHLAVHLQPAQEGSNDASAMDPCLALSGASYKGLENQLYRVEIHQPGGVGEATFKWSRYNGAMAFAIGDFIPDLFAGGKTSEAEIPAKFHRIKLSRLGWDETLRIHLGDLVEVLGDETELLGKPGTLARVMEIDEADLVLTLTADVAGHANESNPKIRRWDMDKSKMAESPSIDGMPTGSISGESGWIEIEKGIEVRFKGGDNYQTGDYWLIPARDSGKIEWPHDENDFVPKFGIQHHSCLLAVLSLSGDGIWKLERDCRKLFSPLSDTILLSHVGGDGQEAMPGFWLPAPFEVRVTRGELPLEGAEISFEIFEGQGVLDPADGSVLTDVGGIARCKCQITKSADQDNFNIRVRAKLLRGATADEISDQTCPTIIFNANASVAAQVAYDPPLNECGQLKGVTTVRGAIDGLCHQVSFSYAGGDGQEAIAGKKLAEPFRVRVARGSYPVKNAVVNFKIDSGKGLLESDKVGTDLDIETDPNGIAACYCTPKENATIRAILKKPDPPSADTAPVIWFNADVIIAEQVAYDPKECSPLKGAMTVKDAIDGLCHQVSFTYAGGDGQEALIGQTLPDPFMVMVRKGPFPLVGAKVIFTVNAGGGKLKENRGDAGQENSLEILADENGIAACYFELGKKIASRAGIEVSADLFDPRQETAQTIFFHPQLSRGRILATWVHGKSFILEQAARGFSIAYDDKSAIFSAKVESTARIFFSIPVTLDSENSISPRALEARIGLDIASMVSISRVVVTDGGSLYLEAKDVPITNGEIIVSLDPSGKPISFGIGITLEVKFDPKDGQVAQISFRAAGCKILSNW